jgi:hypothetical protein
MKCFKMNIKMLNKYKFNFNLFYLIILHFNFFYLLRLLKKFKLNFCWNFNIIKKSLKKRYFLYNIKKSIITHVWLYALSRYFYIKLYKLAYNIDYLASYKDYINYVFSNYYDLIRSIFCNYNLLIDKYNKAFYKINISYNRFSFFLLKKQKNKKYKNIKKNIKFGNFFSLFFLSLFIYFLFFYIFIYWFNNLLNQIEYKIEIFLLKFLIYNRNIIYYRFSFYKHNNELKNVLNIYKENYYVNYLKLNNYFLIFNKMKILKFSNF